MSPHEDEFPIPSDPICSWPEPKAACETTRDLPRRCYLGRFTPLEVAAFELIRACEVAGAHPKLTEAQSLAIRARDIIADWVDLPASEHHGRWTWATEPGAWDPLRFDADYPRPWDRPRPPLASDEPPTNAEWPYSLALDLEGAQMRLLQGLAEEGTLGGSPDDVALYLITRGLDDLQRAGAIRVVLS